MAIKSVAPTKTNLLRMREDLRFATQGYELLDQKRTILIIELLALIDQTVDAQTRIDEGLAKAYQTLEEAVLRMGRLKILCLSSAVNIHADVRIKSRKVMGVTLPVIETDFIEGYPYFSPAGTSFWIDISVESFKSALILLGKFSELKISVLRLSKEVKKTIKKVNALERIAIPDLKETVHFIENRLEEAERDMFVLMKKVKERLEKKEELTKA